MCLKLLKGFLIIIVAQKMSDIMNMLVAMIRKEMDKPEYKQQILEPVNQWIFSVMWPYALGIIGVNFFMTIAAVSLVLYFTIIRNNIILPKIS